MVRSVSKSVKDFLLGIKLHNTESIIIENKMITSLNGIPVNTKHIILDSPEKIKDISSLTTQQKGQLLDENHNLLRTFKY